MSRTEDATVIASRSARALAAAGAVMRFLMHPRDLEHPEACDLLAGNPLELASPAYVSAVQRAVVPDSPAYYRYGPPWRPAIEAVTSALAGRLGLDLEPEDVFLTRGASSGLLLLMRTLLDPGDQVLMMSPPWFFYEAMVLAESAEPVKVDLTEGGFDLDLPAIERAITPRTRAVIINTPHNPSGRIYPEDQLRGLGEVLERATSRNRRRVYLLSDEAYARILFDGREMITPARFYAATFMLHSYSKTLLAPSQRAGYLAMAPAMPDREQLRRALMLGSISGGSVPDTAMQHAMPELERQIIDLAAVERRRDRMVAVMRGHGYAVESPEAGFYLFPRSPIPDAVEFCGWLDERRVYTLPGEAFERPGHFRISLTATDEMVERALPVLGEAIRTFSV
ncbi:MAG TPA: aminotransferase class I/II-fold pyridoxal phosphate-dependent enzyme [Candidatus Dormibacteraeota bacterium]|nr:aminotransferase class I/II-fold pyridoxal phosphate-dependent enzyme [Candidatus Dormibacteraeota bacterium]